MPVAAAARRGVKLRQLEPSVAVRGLHRDLGGIAVTIVFSPVHSRPRIEGECEERILDAAVGCF